MLRRLLIEDYGLIASAEIDFARGATMFTGETGSGKTMVVGALAFALGERTATHAVRRGRPRARVTLEFDAPAEVRDRLKADGFDLDSDEDVTVSRELSAEGKSALRLNSRPATAGYVREIAGGVIDMIGQHEAQRLLQPAHHMALLDSFGDCTSLRRRVASVHDAAQQLRTDIEELDRGEHLARERADYVRYALSEIHAAAPALEEDEALTARRRVLDNAEKIAVALRMAHTALAGDETAARDALGSAASALGSISGIGESFQEVCDRAGALQSDVTELASDVNRLMDQVEFDPAELERVNARLDVLDGLKRKYGGTLEAVLESARSFAAAAQTLEDSAGRRAALEAQLAAAENELETFAQELSAARTAAADKLRKRVETELDDLALASARFSVRLEPLDRIERTGRERVEFLFAANKGEPERALSRVASGGELSRVLLALVVVLAKARGSAALVFDEIDAGVGGATAAAVGVRLGRLAEHAQVVCVTHLAQIASWADEHYLLEKRESRNAAAIEVIRLRTQSERTEEVARMLSGETHEAALKHARILLRQTR